MKVKCKKVLNWALPYLAIATIIYIIMYPQLISHGVILGTDSIFHFNRFYDTAKQIQQGNWSYFQSNFSFQQSGRVINAVYGPLFAYLNGILLGLLGTWFRYQVISSFLVYFIGGVGMYQLAIKVKASRRIALLVSMIFLCLGWLPRWELAQNMNAWGAALAPYMIMLGITMLQDRARPVHWLPLMSLMTIIVQIHLLAFLHAYPRALLRDWTNPNEPPGTDAGGDPQGDRGDDCPDRQRLGRPADAQPPQPHCQASTI